MYSPPAKSTVTFTAEEVYRGAALTASRVSARAVIACAIPADLV